MPLDTRARPRHRHPLSPKLLLGIAVSLAAASTLPAASGVWSGAADGAWSNVSNWSANPVPGAGETATFNGASANTTIDLGAGVTIGSVLFDTASAAAYTIGSGGAGAQTLTLGTAGAAVTMNSTVAANELFNANLALSVTRAAGNVATYYQAANNSATNTLTLAGGISASTAGVKVLNVTGSGNTAISGAIASGSGNMSLFKTGAGNLTLSGGATFSGNGVTDGANFASSSVFREGVTVLNGGTYNNSNGELVIGGVATHGGAGTDTTLQLDNGAVLNNITWLSIGRGNGNGTATSNLTLNGSSSISSTNMSAGFNAGNTANIPKGTITLNGTSSLNVTGTFNLGESPGAAMTMTLNDSSTVTLGSGTIAVGVQSGNGTLNVNSGTSFTTNGEIRVAFSGSNGIFTGSGTLNVNGGTVSTRALTVARNNNDVASTLNATVNVNSGTLEVKDQQSLIGWRGTSSTGTLNISGGSFNHGTVAAANFVIGSFTGTVAAVNISGTGALTLQRNSNVLFSNVANANASRTLTIGGGAMTFYSDAGSSVGGTGVIDLMNTSNPTGTSTINLDGGTLTANQIKATSATGTRVVNFNGGTLKAGSGNATLNTAFLANGVATTANVRDGGAIIDTNGSDVTIGQPLLHSSIGGDNATDGGLTKRGGGTLTLTGANTYTGDTAIDAGGLALADNASLSFVIGASGVGNKIVGSGGITVDGDFVFDLAGAGTTIGDSWQIVGTSLAKTFGGTFTVPGFTLNGGKWFRPDNGAFYEFDPSTGVLSVISDPDISYPAPSATQGDYGTAYSIGSDIILSVSASGLGTITYQWYYQVDAGATPVAISGATGATLTVSGTTADSSGLYSVVVSDHAAEASGKPATTTTVNFSPITVAPAAELALVYYRFENGANGDSISPALDSIGGGNDLTLLGAATYSASGTPYATVPATGAADTLGAHLPASGNNGLVAPLGGPLADTVLTDFTVEAFVRFNDPGAAQTIVGRDDSLVAGSGSLTAGQGVGDQALFYLSKDAAGKFRVELITKDNRDLQINSASTATVGTWYHVAAVGKAGSGTLKLYVNGAEVGSVTGFNGLFVPTAGSDTPWTVGRGDYRLGDADFLRGDVDEVRITRAALLPSQFLNSAGGVAVVHPVVSISPDSTAVYPGANVLFTATATSAMGGTLGYQWYKDGVPLDGETGATLSRASVASDADDASYSVVVADSAAAALGIPAATTATARLVVLDVPAAGARAIGLNFVGAATGNNIWSKELGTLSSGRSAGIYPMANWNNSASVTGVAVQTTPLALMESTASTSAAITATWNSTGAWSATSATGLVSQKTPDALLLHGYIESRAATGSTVTLSNIPYASYDVYVHVAGGAGGEVGSLGIDREGSPIYYYRVLQYDRYAPSTAPTAEAPYSLPLVLGESLARTDALAAAPATFVRFTGVTGPDLTITAIDAVLTKNSGGIAAVEIVDRTPSGSGYPPVVTSAPASKIAQGGANVSFAITAVSQNSGTLSYQWRKDGADLPGQTGATLSLSGVTGASSGNYSVAVTDTSALGAVTITRTASLVVVDGTRSLLINGDINIASSPTNVGDGILRADGTRSATGLGAGSTVWNGVIGASGAATRPLARESSGLALSGVTFSYSGANGAEDNTTSGGGVADPVAALERDYLYANAGATTPLVGTVSGLQALAGKQVTLLVYAVGKTAKAGAAVNSATVNDVATVTLAPDNNYLVSPAGQTTVLGIGSTEDPGRNIEFNNPYYYGSDIYNGAAYVAFTGVVDVNGTVSWNLTPVSVEAGGGGLVPLVGFQLLVTSVDVAPPVPAGLSATAGTGQVGLGWTASDGATSYTVKRATSVAGPYTAISAGLSVTSLTDNDVTAGTTYYYTVAAKNDLAQSADSAPVSATPASPLSGLQTWRQSHFGTTANEGDAADAADPDHDGQANLLEYALGTDPNVAGVAPVTAGRSGDVLMLSFDHIADSTLVYTVQASNDLANWSTAQTYTGFTSSGLTTYTDNVSLATQARRFLRLVVTAP